MEFLKDHLKPLTLSKDDLDAELKDLASDDEKVWRPAFDYLCYFDPRLAVDLPTLIADTPDAVPTKAAEDPDYAGEPPPAEH